jgi:hypothetical protein
MLFALFQLYIRLAIHHLLTKVVTDSEVEVSQHCILAPFRGFGGKTKTEEIDYQLVLNGYFTFLSSSLA